MIGTCMKVGGFTDKVTAFFYINIIVIFSVIQNTAGNIYQTYICILYFSGNVIYKDGSMEV